MTNDIRTEAVPASSTPLVVNIVGTQAASPAIGLLPRGSANGRKVCDFTKLTFYAASACMFGALGSVLVLSSLGLAYLIIGFPQDPFEPPEPEKEMRAWVILGCSLSLGTLSCIEASRCAQEACARLNKFRSE